MPIRPENRHRYPKGWKQISERIRYMRARGRCECEGECRDDHNGRCTALESQPHPKTGSIVVLTVAHLNHEPEDCRDENLKAMCQRCHNRYDGPKRRAGILERKRAGSAIGDLFDD